ncbi:Uncharacterised protein [Staphylococcus aureus]|nr:hypothetical protein [Staphylococcus aureus]SUM30499.1 Uncharacterised protein [Staphylococcus aureus]
METRDIKIRSVDVETIKRIDRMAKKKNISRKRIFIGHNRTD